MVEREREIEKGRGGGTYYQIRKAREDAIGDTERRHRCPPEGIVLRGFQRVNSIKGHGEGRTMDDVTRMKKEPTNRERRNRSKRGRDRYWNTRTEGKLFDQTKADIRT